MAGLRRAVVGAGSPTFPRSAQELYKHLLTSQRASLGIQASFGQCTEAHASVLLQYEDRAYLKGSLQFSLVRMCSHLQRILLREGKKCCLKWSHSYISCVCRVPSLNSSLSHSQLPSEVRILTLCASSHLILTLH